MQIKVVSSEKARPAADVVVVPCWKEKGKKASFKEFETLLQNEDFTGKEAETLLLYRSEGSEKRVLLLGLGEQKGCQKEGLRKAYAAAVKCIRSKKWARANFLFPEGEMRFAAMEGVLLANYSFDFFKKDEKPSIEVLHFCGLKKGEETHFERTQILIESVGEVRDLVNGNADNIDTDHFCTLARQLKGVKATILDRKQLEKEKAGLILAVGRGAASNCAIILLEYRGAPRSKEITALIGKGITYDTGGLNLKPTGSIETMKCDMAGAGCVFGTLKAAARLKLKKNIIGVLALAENAIGPLSYKPGDVYKSHSGKTVEISNTDAEGRLVLADALSIVQKRYAPTRMIDLATLTGGIVVALGEEATGLYSNDEHLAKALEKAAMHTDERVWRMPLYPEYAEMLKSPIADLKNSASRKASPCTAAAFLQQFVEKETPWAHLDIAGTAYLSELKPYHPTYATGVGVRLLIDFLENLDEKVAR